MLAKLEHISIHIITVRESHSHDCNKGLPLQARFKCHQNGQISLFTGIQHGKLESRGAQIL